MPDLHSNDRLRLPGGRLVIRISIFSLITLLALASAAAAIAETRAAATDQPTAGKVPTLLLVDGKGKSGHGLGLPPGQAKKWVRGQYLPKTIVWTPAPAAILAHLKPAPPGHRYVVVDGEVLLIALATGLILEAVDVI